MKKISNLWNEATAKAHRKNATRLVASVSAVAMLATLAISGTAFALGSDDGDDTTTDTNTTTVQQTTPQTDGDTNGDAATGTTDGTTDTDKTGNDDQSDTATGTADAESTDQSASDDQKFDTTASEKQSDQSQTNVSDDAQKADDAQKDAEDSGTDSGVSTAADFTADPSYAKHTVQGITPSNVKMDLFDYWISGQNDVDDTNGIDSYDRMFSGINENHSLKFSRNGFGTEGGNSGTNAPNNGSMNNWTGKTTDSDQRYTNRGGPFSGIVTDTLKGGYPVLARGNHYLGSRGSLTTSTNATTGDDESLNYLFDPSIAANGKQTFSNVSGLLQLNDNNGLYEYDSQKNFASYDSASNSFVLYDGKAVSADRQLVADKQDGQFFPFNSASQVFQSPNRTNADGTLAMNENVTSYNANLRHYFGLHMNSEFSQPTGGQVNGTNMQFNFSGDDDVWVYIDGILVGDLGGLHDRLTLNIDFKTGDVIIRNGASYDSSTVFKETTLRSLMLGKTDSNGNVLTADDFNGNTFIDESEHTLDFFYLERGNGNSNLQLSTNLASRPANDMIKVDQNGNPISGASFDLYKADADYKYTDADLVANGTTNDEGILTFIDNSTHKRINFDMYAKDPNNKITHYVLKETTTPSGYRTAADTKLMYYTGGEDVGQTGLLLADPAYLWETGAYATAKETVTITNINDVTDVDGNKHSETEIEDALDNGGELFAVILKRDSKHYGTVPSDADTWRIVTGDPINGWDLSDPIGDIDTVDPSKVTHFDFKKQDGFYTVSLENLPGDIRYYYNMLNAANKKDTQFTVGYYLRNAQGTTVRLTGNQFSRVFASRLQITNIKNYLFVQKTDEDGNPISVNTNGQTDADKQATFVLYTADQVTVDAEGKVTPKDGITPFDTAKTQDMVRKVASDGNATGMDLTGGAVFPSQTDGDGTDKELPEGTYYLKETAAPKGYQVNDNYVKVIVDVNGVHADAGKDNDLVATRVGVGSLVASMAQTGNADQVDQTMHDITVNKRTGTLTADGKLTWTDEVGSKVDLSYGGNGVILEYGLSGNQDGKSQVGYYSSTGWSWFGAKQNYDCATDYPGEKCGNTALKLDLSQAPYNNPDTTKLFSGTTTVIIGDKSNKPTKQISVIKRVEGKAWDGKSNFEFDLTRVDGSGDDTVTYAGNNGETALNKDQTIKATTNGPIDTGSKGQKQLDFARLTFPAEDKTYEFRIKEIVPTDKPAGWSYDTGGLNKLNGDTGFKVTVVVTCSEADGACTAVTRYGDSTDQPNPDTGTAGSIPTFVNAYVAVSSLPLTGGDASARDWLIGGGVFAALAAAALALTYEYRRRKALGV
ncbi:SpaA isopeptide-forming pilin-related protein [Bifidobacterium aerophilum]|uniref:SpaA-like prealbumin fold domain-containing protein n=1 Tax=Bifidobacterium aerophilum TaxID=1798155 RepID=A0A6N9Z4W0_9BIFI|nr:SpaA isopeptide-forming pilin-related protein [Bifidobacterium aerophilum]NEG89450.1 hypothetical protein [Bifidobacterium aerophilum]